MNPSRVISFPNGTAALVEGTRVALAVQNGVVVTVPAGTNNAVGVVMRDIAPGGVPPTSTNTSGFGTYSTSDILMVGPLMYGVTDGVITAGQTIYGQVGGLITASVTGNPIGIATQTSIGAGDVIEFIPTSALL